MSTFDFVSTEVKISGFRDLDRVLEKLTKTQIAVGLQPLLVKSLTPMSEIAASIAPDDPKTSSPWDLGDSITVSTRQRSGGARNDRALGQYVARAYMGPTKYGYPQAMMQEFGTVHQVGSPYMRPTWDTMKHSALEIIKDGYAKHVFNAARTFAKL